MISSYKNIAVLYNSDDSTGDSQAAAEYLADARGIPPGNVGGVAFGTTYNIAYADAAAYRAGALTDANTFLTSLSTVEGVVVSINCPHWIKLIEAGAYGDYSGFCKVIGNVDYVISGPDIGAQNTMYFHNVEVDNLDGSNSGSYTTWYRHYGPWNNYEIVKDWRNAYFFGSHGTSYPCGRLGYSTGSFDDDLDLAKRCIDDAIWAENNINPLEEPILTGLSYRNTYLTIGEVMQAYTYLLDRGFKNLLTYHGNYADDANSKYSYYSYSFPLPDITIPDQVTWLQGGGPLTTLWGWVGTGFENNGNAYLPSVNFKRGAWMFESTSGDVSKYSLLNNACACIIPVREPTTSGVPQIDGLIRLLLQGYSMMEADYAAQTGPSYLYHRFSEAWGDPTYSPLASVGMLNRAGLTAACGQLR